MFSSVFLFIMLLAFKHTHMMRRRDDLYRKEDKEAICKRIQFIIIRFFKIYFQEDLRPNHSKVIVDEVFCCKNVVFFQDFSQSQSV